MIYFDNAATTFPKPRVVNLAVQKAINEYGGNPGRAGHKLAMNTAEAVFIAREKCADFFGATVENTIFTLNCTHALNTAIKGIGEKFSHYVISDVEHNAVSRPVHAMTKMRNGKCTYSIAKTYDDYLLTLASFEKLITSQTTAVVCTAASNVTGKVLPYREIAKLCQKRGVCFILDAAQGGGLLSIKIGDGINFICCSGHKGLYGIMGSGILVSDGNYRLNPLMEGGTGGSSYGLEQPDNCPDKFESGTGNTAGSIALGAGIDFLNQIGTKRIYEHERELCQLFMKEISYTEKIKLYFKPNEFGEYENPNRTPIVPFNIDGMNSNEVTEKLSKAGFALRGGLHCAYLTHKKLNTLETGIVRFAPSAFNNRKEVLALVRFLRTFIN